MLNIKKTKEVVFDPRSVGDHSPVLINGERVQKVTPNKYLGIHFDSQLQWAHQVEYVCSRISQRLHFLRRLRVCGVDKRIMLLIYRAAIESINGYGITTWFGNLSVRCSGVYGSVCDTAC